MTDLSRLRRKGPLAAYAPGFAAELTANGYADATVANHLRLMAHVSRWLDSKRLPVEELTPKRVAAFAADRRAAGDPSLCSPRSLRRLLAFLEGAGVEVATSPPSWLDRLCGDYQGYLVTERALQPATIVAYLAVTRAFVVHAHVSSDIELEMLTPDQVRAFALVECRRLTPKGAGNRMGGLRAFLHYLYLTSVTLNPLGAAVPSIAGWSQTTLPGGSIRLRWTRSWPPATAAPMWAVVTSPSSWCCPAWGCGPVRWRSSNSTMSTGERARSPSSARAAPGTVCPCPSR